MTAMIDNEPTLNSFEVLKSLFSIANTFLSITFDDKKPLTKNAATNEISI